MRKAARCDYQFYMEPEGRGFSYFRDKEQTAQSHRGRSFNIGDIRYLDEDGYLFIVDRKKDMIISGVGCRRGSRWATRPRMGERVCAFVQAAPGVHADEELAAELVAYVRQRLDPSKCPRQIWFRDQLPRNDAGKLVKRELKDELIAASVVFALHANNQFTT